MIYGLYLSANGMITQKMSSETLSNNLANVSTHGFKRDFLALRQRDPEVLRQGGIAAETQRHLLAIGGAVEGDRTHSIFDQGAMQPTGTETDLALNGTGFFKLQAPDGKVYYSRQGAFQRDAQNFMTGVNGFRLLSNDGEPLQAEGQTYVFDEEGRLIVDGDPAGQVAVVDLENVGDLHKIGENLFELFEGEPREIPSLAQIRPGFLEASSVRAVQEMSSMIEAHRAYEANARFIRIQDETLGKAVTQIAG